MNKIKLNGKNTSEIWSNFPRCDPAYRSATSATFRKLKIDKQECKFKDYYVQLLNDSRRIISFLDLGLWSRTLDLRVIANHFEYNLMDRTI